MKIKANRLIDAMKALQSLDAMEKPLEIDGSVRVTLYRNGSRIRNEGEIYEIARSDTKRQYRSKRIAILEESGDDSTKRELELAKTDEWFEQEIEELSDQEVEVVIKPLKMRQLNPSKNRIPITALIALDFMIIDEEANDESSGED